MQWENGKEEIFFFVTPFKSAFDILVVGYFKPNDLLKA